jgi:hypothetical protein
LSTLAERLHTLFAGLERAHGHFIEGDKPTPGQKLEKKNAWTRKTGATVKLWEQHLAGKYGLGIPPLREDGTCRWAAIDIDNYEIDHAQLYERIQELALPILPARSKSGGAHGLVFFSEDISARILRPILLDWALALGCSKDVEIFPKQDYLEPTECGNWLNMPYYGGRYSTRYGIGPHGSLTPEEFLEVAERLAIRQDRLTPAPSLPKPKPAKGSKAEPSQSPMDWSKAPPCMELFADTGYQAGARNNALFNLAVLARKMDADGWPEQVREMNGRYIHPPLTIREVSDIVKSLKKKSYNYKCNDVPIQSYCKKDVCLNRTYGVAAGGPVEFDFPISRIVRIDTDPVVWEAYVDEQPVRCSTEQLTDQKQFRNKCLEVLGRLPARVKPRDWDELLDTWLESLVVQQVPQDATPAGQMLVFLDRYCTDRSAARQEDEILLGKPYSNGDGFTYFQSADFLKFLRQQGIPNVRASEVYLVLNNTRGAKSEMREYKGKRVRIWGVFSAARQTAPFEPPRKQPEGEF